MADYDPYANRVVTKPLTNLEALISILKVVVGTGILALPLAFHYTGIIGGPILTLLIIAWLIYGIHVLVKCMVIASARNRVGYMTFPETMQYAFEVGPPSVRCFATCSGHFVDFILCSSHYGINVVYLVFAAVNLQQFLDHYGTSLDVRVIIAFAGIVMLPIFQLRELKYLVPINAFATILDLWGLVAIVWYFFHGLGSLSDREKFPTEINNIPLMMGIVMFSVSSVGGQLAIESKMLNPADYLGWFGVLNLGAIIFTSITLFFGFMGYWRYGEDIKAAVTLNIPMDEFLAQLIKLAIMIAVFLTYPLCGYVPIDIILHHYIQNETNPHLVECILRIGYVVVSTINAIAFPNLGPLLGLVGAFSVSLLNLIFPCILELCVLYSDTYGRFKWILWKNTILIILGLITFVYGTFSAVIHMIDEYGGPSITTDEPLDTTEAGGGER